MRDATKNPDYNPNVISDLIHLRDELASRAFNESGRVVDAQLTEVMYKINSCLYKGYPRKKQSELPQELVVRFVWDHRVLDKKEQTDA
jgi:hypothetical protein